MDIRNCMSLYIVKGLTTLAY